MKGTLVAVLMIVIFASIISAVLTNTQDDAVKDIYAQVQHNVTLSDGVTKVETPAPFLSPALQVKVRGLAPIGVWVGSGIAIFVLMFSSFGKKKGRY